MPAKTEVRHNGFRPGGVVVEPLYFYLEPRRHVFWRQDIGLPYWGCSGETERGRSCRRFVHKHTC